jgi:hypothetical protein
MARPVSAAAIEAEVERLVAQRGPGKTICPSEVARSLAPEAWRPLLGPVRDAAARLALRGRVGLFRKGKRIAPDEMRGVLRLGLPGATTGDGDE